MWRYLLVPMFLTWSLLFGQSSGSYLITTLAGGGTETADGGVATMARLKTPEGVAVDAAGNLYIADTGNNRILKVTPDGVVRKIAGDGTAGFRGDGGQATLARLNQPLDLAIDVAGNIYIADTKNARIRKVSAAGIITTFAGNGVVAENGTKGFIGDGGPATLAWLGAPSGVAIDASGSLYIADPASSNPNEIGGHRIRKVTSLGIISTVTASLSSPRRVAVDSGGSIYIADIGNRRITKVSPDGIISTVVGDSVRMPVFITWIMRRINVLSAGPAR